MPTGSLELLVNHLMETGVLKTPAIIDAFKKIDRIKFVPDNAKQWAYIDEALSIGAGQTISQPYTVAFILELLEPKPGEKILDIGAGSGWQTSLLAHIVGDPSGGGGRVFAIEIVPELCKFGEANVSKFNFAKKGIVKWLCGDASQKTTFDPVRNEISSGVDKIIAAAALKDDLPQEWKDQLKIGGRMVIPIRNSIWLFIKKDEENFKTVEYPGFSFVPFVINQND
jgi:protein-L-isoaspartate(D-aspartate) O-methyltransferase